MEFRTLRADEIEVRVKTVKESGCQLLLYKDARCDMNILDETVGRGSWQRSHYELKGNIYCSVQIDCRKEGEALSRWVSKDDCGSESNTEKEKGEASDSFKRACVNWGIGRELYTAPFIWIAKDKVRLQQAGNGSWRVLDRFVVEKIAYDERRRISGLAIKNTEGKRVFVWQRKEQ